MGTRSTTLFVEKDRNENGKVRVIKLCRFYRQMDGYPDGHGLDLAKYLQTGILVNGIGYREDNKYQFNGIGCLAASVIAHFKQGSGGIYMIPLSHENEDYNYTITVLSPWFKQNNPNDQTPDIMIKVTSDNKKIFEGTPDEFVEKFAEKA